MRRVAFWLSLVLIFAVPWEDMAVFPGKLSLHKAIGLPIGAFWLASVLATGRFRRLHLLHALVALFLAWNALSLFWAVDPQRTVLRLRTYGQLAIFAWLLWDLYTTPDRLRAGLQVYVLGAYVAIASLISNYLEGSAIGVGRFSPDNVNPNQTGFLLAIAIPMAWHLAVDLGKRGKNPHLKLLNYAYVPIAFFCIVLTGSRGGLICSLPAALYILGTIDQLRLNQRVLILTVGVFVLLSLQPLIPEETFERLGTAGTEIERGDLNGRVRLWRRGMEVFWEHPIIGVGTWGFRAATQTGHAPHNTYLSILVDVGIIGLALFAAILTTLLFQVLQQPKPQARLFLSLLAIWCLTALVANFEHTKGTWLLLSLPLIAAHLSVNGSDPEPDGGVARHAHAAGIPAWRDPQGDRG